MSYLNELKNARVIPVTGSASAPGVGFEQEPTSGWFEDSGYVGLSILTNEVARFGADNQMSVRVDVADGVGFATAGDADTKMVPNTDRWDMYAGNVLGTAFTDEQRIHESVGMLFKRTVVAAASYTIKINDHVVAVTYTATGPVTLTLPSPGSVGAGYMCEVVDEGGLAGTNNIVINQSASEKIVGENSYTIDLNYNSVTLYTNATDWFIL